MKPIFKFCFTLIITISITANSLFAGKFKVLYVPGKKSSFYQTIEKGIRNKSIELGLDFFVAEYPESWNDQEQIKSLSEAYEKYSPELLIISPATRLSLVPWLKRMHLDNTSIITIDQYLGTGRYTQLNEISFPITHISTDNKSAGVELAEQLAKLIDGKGKVYINSTFPDIKSISDRLNGFLTAMDDYPNITITGIDIAGIDFSNKAGGGVGSSQELQQNAYHQTLTILQKHPDIIAIYCTNPLSATGVVKAIEDTGLSGAIKVASWDMTKDQVKAMDDGILDIALSRNPIEIGATAVYWGYQTRVFQETAPQNIMIPFKIISQEDISTLKFTSFFYF